ncbi:hypothetical protein [Sphingomonas sp. ERG5]|uniref:hypothetical protein n=1 Tax=Sphingomonas sp. ERG5 TaxID=1381597 RepID=UPI00054B86B9|nr:hypothetical protein [Sphingomonas sp. ERG5]
MAYDPAAFEGDWWLLIEEQPLERIPEKKWTLGGGRIIRRGEDVGTYALTEHRLTLTVTSTLDGDPDVYWFSIPADQLPLPDFDEPEVNYLSGYIEEEIQLYCTLIREEPWLKTLPVTPYQEAEVVVIRDLFQPRHDPVPARA